MERPEIVDLKNRIETVLRLFNPDVEHPEAQAQEIKDLQDRINARLREIINGTVSIKTSDVEVESMLLPSTHLVLRDRPDAVETCPGTSGARSSTDFGHDFASNSRRVTDGTG